MNYENNRYYYLIEELRSIEGSLRRKKYELDEYFSDYQGVQAQLDLRKKQAVIGMVIGIILMIVCITAQFICNKSEVGLVGLAGVFLIMFGTSVLEFLALIVILINTFSLIQCLSNLAGSRVAAIANRFSKKVNPREKMDRCIMNINRCRQETEELKKKKESLEQELQEFMGESAGAVKA